MSVVRQRDTSSPEVAHRAYARDSRGSKSVYRAPIRTGPQGAFCTAHVFQQVPGQNRIFMGWYTQGTQVVDFTENADGTLDFKEAAYFIPEGANTWVSHVFKTERNADGSFSYYGATDFRRVAFRRTGARFRRLPAYFRGRQCSLVETFKLERPVFGGRRGAPLRIAYGSPHPRASPCASPAAAASCDGRRPTGSRGGRTVSRSPRAPAASTRCGRAGRHRWRRG